MKFFSENMESLRELYINDLKKLLSVERQITEALPKMIDKASDLQLKQAFQSHLQETEQHVTRVEQILRECADEVDRVKSKVLAAMVSDAESMISDADNESVRDVGLISAAQGVEHYEMACYGSVRNYARILGEASQAELLQKTLDEEKHADHLLTQIAERVNPAAQRAERAA